MSVRFRRMPVPRCRRKHSLALRLESLELRQLMSASPLGIPGVSLVEAEPNNTLDVAQNVGDLSVIPAAQVRGMIGNSPAGAAEVDWYQFTVDSPAQVVLLASPRTDSPNFHPVLSLYNNDPYDFQDLYNTTGHRLIAQSDSSSTHGQADITELLSAGTYDLAVSGAGNLYFNPLLAGSGFPGQIGEYNLTLSSTALPIQAGDGPSVLTTTPAAGAVLSSSPLAIRLDLSGPLDPSTIYASQNVELLYSASGSFSQNVQNVSLWVVNFSTAINELQLFPTKALMPGTYEVLLIGQSTSGSPGLADPNGIPLGADATHPSGQEFSYTFQVNGIEGNVGPGAAAADTPTTAHNLGDIATQGLIQIPGAIGADPFYNYSSWDPALNPGNDVNLYHFQISGPGRYALAAEVFAGRIGSPLDPGISLYMLAPDGHTLEFLAGNNNTNNPAQATDGSTPLSMDAALTAGLVAGDYYIAVSSGSNTPSPSENQPLNTPGLFNPMVSHSGTIGYSTGPYVLNLLVQPVTSPPRVVASSLSPGEVLFQSPTQLTVQFSEPVNISQLAFTSYDPITQEDRIPAVFIENQNGVKYYPWLESYDATTNTATFQMPSRLPSGSYALHLSGPAGLADLAGNLLVGNTPGGDDVINFQVDTAASGLSLGTSGGYEETVSVDSPSPDNLGVLFPHEWQAGITLTRNAGTSVARTSDQYQFQVTQSKTYSFVLSGNDLPPGIQLSMTDGTGSPIPFNSRMNGQLVVATLDPGIYRLVVSGWAPGLGASISYNIQLGLQFSLDNPPALVNGPAPALVLHFGATTSPPPTLTGSPIPSPPPSSGGDPTGPLSLLPTGGSGTTSVGGSGSSNGGLLTTSSPSGGMPILPSDLWEMSAGHLGLASLGMGPLGGIGTGVQTEAQTTSVQLAASVPTALGQTGLVTTGVLHAGLNPLQYPADLNPGNEVSIPPVINSSSIMGMEPAAPPSLQDQVKPQLDRQLTPGTLVENGQVIAVVVQNDGRKSGTQPRETAGIAAPLNDSTTGANEVSEATMAPDWVGWAAAAGLVSLAASRLARWRRGQTRTRQSLLHWQGGKQASWTWRRMTLARPHFTLHRSEHRELRDSTACANERV